MYISEAERIKRDNNREVAEWIKIYFAGELEEKIERYKKRLNEKINHYYDIKAVSYSNSKVATSGYSDPTCYKALKVIEYEERVNHTLNFLQQLKEELDGIQGDYRQVLEATFSDKAFTKLQLENMSQYQARKIKRELEREGIKKLRKILAEYVKKIT